MKKAILILSILIILFGIVLFSTTEQIPPENKENYTIYIFDDGSTRINVKSINYVQQKEDGTLIIEGGGKSSEYQYTRKDFVRR